MASLGLDPIGSRVLDAVRSGCVFPVRSTVLAFLHSPPNYIRLFGRTALPLCLHILQERDIALSGTWTFSATVYLSVKC